MLQTSYNWSLLKISTKLHNCLKEFQDGKTLNGYINVKPNSKNLFLIVRKSKKISEIEAGSCHDTH